MSLSAAERETIVTLNDEDAVAHVWTAQRPVITKLRKNPAAKLLEEGQHDGTAWASFEIPGDLLSFRTGRVKRELSPAQRQALGARLKAARAGV